MKEFLEIAKNPYVTAGTIGADHMMGWVRLFRSGKGREYSLVISRHQGDLNHVSISCMDHRHIPTWNEMCELKDICFGEEEECYQIMPKKSEYVNIMKNCMHIWQDEKKGGRKI